MKYKTISAKKRKFFELINKKEIDNLDVKDIINELGISRSTYYRWLEDKELRKRIREETNNELQANLHEVHRTLLRKALKGDIRAIQMYLKKYDIDEDLDEILTTDDVLRIMRDESKSETNNVTN